MRPVLLTGRTIRLTGDGGWLTAALAAHGAALGDDADVAVHVVTSPEALQEQALAELTPEQWSARCDRLILDAIAAAQEAHRRGMSRLLFVVPALGLTGAAGLVPLATAGEAVRSLAKTAARQWGPDGLTITSVAVNVGGPVTAPAALDAPTESEVAGVIALLAHELAEPITGATVVVDGGVVMTP